jgi:hypothetical protein
VLSMSSPMFGFRIVLPAYPEILGRQRGGSPCLTTPPPTEARKTPVTRHPSRRGP